MPTGLIRWGSCPVHGGPAGQRGQPADRRGRLARRDHGAGRAGFRSLAWRAGRRSAQRGHPGSPADRRRRAAARDRRRHAAAEGPGVGSVRPVRGHRPVPAQTGVPPYWGLNDIPLSGSSTASGFTTYGPLTVPAAAFAGPLTVSAVSWLAQPQTASIPSGQLSTVAGNVQALQQTLQNAQLLPGLALTTSLPSVLLGTASNLDVARSLLAVCAVLLFLLAAAALLAVARMLTGQREGESAMLTARGATRWQLVRLTAVEAIPLCALSRRGRRRVRRPARPAARRDRSRGAGARLAQLAGRRGRRGAGDHGGAVARHVTPGAARARRGRQAAISGITRAGADLALVLLAVVAGWQLRHYSAVSAGANAHLRRRPRGRGRARAGAGGRHRPGAAPAASQRQGRRLAGRARTAADPALASWQISRQPISQGGAALLSCWPSRRNAGARAAAELDALRSRSGRVQLGRGRAAWSRPGRWPPGQARPRRLPGVRHAMPVAAFPAGTPTARPWPSTPPGRGVALLRPDQSPLPAGALFARIGRPARRRGSRCPAARRGSGSPRAGPASLPLAPVTVSVTAEDADGDAYQLRAGTLPADGRPHTLTAGLPGGSAIYPLRLTAITASYTLPATRAAVPAVLPWTALAGGPRARPPRRPAAALPACAQAGASVARAVRGPDHVPRHQRAVRACRRSRRHRPPRHGAGGDVRPRVRASRQRVARRPAPPSPASCP